MKCTIVQLDGTAVIVCGSRRCATKRCACGSVATKLCDAPVVVGVRGLITMSCTTIRTCDAPLCEKCATSAGPGKDLCPAHVSRPPVGQLDLVL